VVQRVDSNLLNGGIILSSEWFTRYAGKPTRRLADKGQYGLDAWHRLYQAHDGWLYVVAETSAERLALCRALDCADVGQANAAPPAGGHPAETPLAQALTQRFAGLSLAESLARLQKAGVPCAPAVAGHSELFLDDPHAAPNDMVVLHQHPVIGRQQLARHYVRFGNTQAVPGRPTPLLGEHTREILQEVGFTEQGIAELYTRGVVRTEEPAGA
jgi:crotonobetainyl-CoA:carnitine CoA-transferase CaiB-like acyl-CoA transferase